MKFQLLNIAKKQRRDRFWIVESQDFALTPTNQFIDAEKILHNPDYSLYCLNDQTRHIYYVNHPGLDLTEAPFVHQAQYNHAHHLASISYDDFKDLIDPSVPFNVPFLIYSTGRSGSTLLSRLMNKAPGVYSLSEADVYTQLQMLRGLHAPKGESDKEFIKLISAISRNLWKPCQPDATHLALKFRSFSIEIGTLIHEALPGSRAIFIYRNAETQLLSNLRAFGDGSSEFLFRLLTMTKGWQQRWSTLIGVLNERPGCRRSNLGLSMMELWLLSWLSSMRSYLRLYQLGIPMVALRYEDLIARPEMMLQAVFEYFQLDNNYIPEAMQEFQRDSQHGTSISRQALKHRRTRLKPNEVVRLTQILNDDPYIKSPDYILPGTLLPEDSHRLHLYS
jgi:hypothetical protein